MQMLDEKLAYCELTAPARSRAWRAAAQVLQHELTYREFRDHLRLRLARELGVSLLDDGWVEVKNGTAAFRCYFIAQSSTLTAQPPFISIAAKLNRLCRMHEGSASFFGGVESGRPYARHLLWREADPCVLEDCNATATRIVRDISQAITQMMRVYEQEMTSDERVTEYARTLSFDRYGNII